MITALSANKTYRWRVRVHYPSGWFISSAPYPEFTTLPQFTNGGGGEKGSENGISALMVSPNPTNGSTVVSMSFSSENQLESTGRLCVQSLDGRLVLEKPQLPLADLNAYELDLSSLRAGIYVLSVSTSEGVFAQKLVVQ